MADPTRNEDKGLFEYQKPTIAQVERMERVRHGCQMLLHTLMLMAEPCRERSIAITKLEEVCMWTNKAIAVEYNTRPAQAGE